MTVYRVVPIILIALAIGGCRAPALHESNMRVVLQASPRGQSTWPRSASAQAKLMQEARRVVQNRLKGIPGVAEIVVKTDGSDKLILSLTPAPRSTRDLHRCLTTTGTLEFYYLKDVQTNNNPMGQWRMDAPLNEGDAYVFTGPRGETIDSIKQPKEVLTKVVNAAKNPPILTGKDILPNAKATVNQRNQVVVNIEFNRQGTARFSAFTRAHVDDILAVFFDGALLTAPTIQDAITGGKAEITGFRGPGDAGIAAEALNAGTLPVALKVVSTTVTK